MTRASQVIVLTEDRRQQTFVLRFLERAGYRADQIRPQPLPAGKGSGEQWVRQKYADNVEAYRIRATRAATALIIAIDADTNEITQRVNQLAQALKEANLPVRTAAEKIAHLIPKRNIETWVLCLNGVEADENTDYKNRIGSQTDIQIKPAAIAFFEGSRSHSEPPAHWVNSVRTAVPEVRRLD
jgi:hypothetical protein